VAESLRWVTHVLNAAEASGDPDLLIVGHNTAVVAYIWLGDLIKAREYADRVLALYSEERHGHLADMLNHDPKTASLTFSALLTWMLGYPEQAVKKRIEEGDRVGRENRLPLVTECLVPINSGTALIRKGRTADGMALLERGLAVWEEGGGRFDTPYYESVRAKGMAQLGDLARALDLIDEIIAQVERPGREERYYYAEILRIKGWLLARRGDLAAAERAYLASLDWARQQKAKSWELRTATSYARLMRNQGRACEAHDQLAPIYGWFTEGFATKDLKEAKVLLQELETADALEPRAPA
jgi:predicted ATPase